MADFRIIVESASQLVPADLFSAPDPYVEVTYDDQKQKTIWKKDTNNPVWNQVLYFKNWQQDGVLHFKLYDYDLVGSDDFLGEFELPLNLSEEGVYKDTLTLENEPEQLRKKKQGETGSLTFEINVMFPSNDPETVPVEPNQDDLEKVEIDGVLVPLYDCVIVGAGFSGISAAQILHQQNRSVKVFEMNDFYGGRTWTKSRTLNVNGNEVDLELNMGGEYFAKYFQVAVNRYEHKSPFNPKTVKSLQLGTLYQLATTKNVPFTDSARNAKSTLDGDTFQTKGLCSSFYGTESVYPEDYVYRWAIPPEEWESPVAGGLPYSGGNPKEGWPVDQTLAMSLILVLLEGVSACYGYYRNQPWLCPLTDSYNSISVEDWVSRKVWLENGPAGQTVRMSASVYFSTNPKEISPQYFVWYSILNGSVLAAVNDFNLGPQQYFFNGGMQSMYDAEFGKYKPLVQLNTLVSKVESSGDYQVVTTSSGEVVAGRTVLIAGSPKTIGNTIQFNPPLSPGRQIFEEQGMGRTLKCYLYYDTPWWRDLEITYYYKKAVAGSAGYNGYFAAVGPIPGGTWPDTGEPVEDPAWVVWCMDNTIEPEPEVYTLMFFVIADGIDDQPNIDDQDLIAKKIAQQLSVQWSTQLPDQSFTPTLAAYDYLSYDMFIWRNNIDCPIGGGPVTVMASNVSNEIGNSINYIQDVNANRFFAGSEYAQNMCGNHYYIIIEVLNFI
eukprot:TRINITY_DN10628_c0_g1_i1.p1 TRINITY_DN10628_c0_g1~~TRINITY_DN10628_c0_g1_i1.p1  ORF type:complete len:732 (-),score=194.27 TRINITY_DN10628_c0_g1_i1:916-3072(-)